MVGLVGNGMSFIGNCFLPLPITHYQPTPYNKCLIGHDINYVSTNFVEMPAKSPDGVPPTI